MFMAATELRNPGLIEAAVWLHQSGQIEPDTYVLDLDGITANGRLILDEGREHDIQLYFMTKQMGRNPLIAEQLIRMGYRGAVAVDFREAKELAAAGIPIGHVGHLVQIPSQSMSEVVRYGPEVVTVYSREKAMEVAAAARNLGQTQKILLKVVREGDLIYPGQEGGFFLSELREEARKIAALPGISLAGVTAFPCFLYDELQKDLIKTPNMETLQMAREMLLAQGMAVEQVNAPSATCCRTIAKLSEEGATHGEPGHGLLGTTPLHAIGEEPEIPAVTYVSEVSHRFCGRSYCFGGGHYRRSGMTWALAGKDARTMRKMKAYEPDPMSIDYHFALDGEGQIGDSVVFSFRTQIFATRSHVAVVEGVSEGKPRLVGVYDSQGRELRRQEAGR